MQNSSYQEKVEGIRVKIQEQLEFLAGLERSRKLMEKLSDEELRIYQKNPYYGYYKKDAAWPVTNFSNFPEFKGDSVFQKILQIYEKFPFHDNNEIKLSLSQLATDMANRAMKEDVYNLLNEDKHPLLDRAYVALSIK